MAGSEICDKIGIDVINVVVYGSSVIKTEIRFFLINQTDTIFYSARVNYFFALHVFCIV